MPHDKLELEIVNNPAERARCKDILESEHTAQSQRYFEEEKAFKIAYNIFLEDPDCKPLQEKIKSRESFASLNHKINTLIKREFANLPQLQAARDRAFNQYMQSLRIKNANIFLLQTYDKDFTTIGTVGENISNERLVSRLEGYEPTEYTNHIFYKKQNEQSIEELQDELRDIRQKISDIEKDGINIIYPRILEFLKNYIPFAFAIYQYFNPKISLELLIKESKTLIDRYQVLRDSLQTKEKELLDTENTYKEYSDPDKNESLKTKYDTYQDLLERKNTAISRIKAYPNQALHDSLIAYETNCSQPNLVQLCESLIRCGHEEKIRTGNNALESVLDVLQEIHPEESDQIDTLKERMQRHLQGAYLTEKLQEEDLKILKKNKEIEEQLITKNKMVENIVENIKKQNIKIKKYIEVMEKKENIKKSYFDNFEKIIGNPIKYLNESYEDISIENTNKIINDYNKNNNDILKIKEKLFNLNRNKDFLKEELDKSLKEKNEFILNNENMIKERKNLHEIIMDFFNSKNSKNLLCLYSKSREYTEFDTIKKILKELYPETLDALLAKDQLIITSNIELSSNDRNKLRTIEALHTPFILLTTCIENFFTHPTWGNYDALKRALAKNSDYYHYEILESFIDRFIITISQKDRLKNNEDKISSALMSDYQKLNDLVKNVTTSTSSLEKDLPNKVSGLGLFDKPKETNKENPARVTVEELLVYKKKFFKDLELNPSNDKLWTAISGLSKIIQLHALFCAENNTHDSKEIMRLYHYLSTVILITSFPEAAKAKTLTELYHNIHASMDKLPGHPIQEIIDFLLEKLEKTDEYQAIPQHPSYKA